MVFVPPAALGPAPRPRTSARSTLTPKRVVVQGLILWGGCLATTRAVAEPSPLEPEVGYNYSEQETPRMTALGGATRAGSNSVTALYSNPANMALTQVYHATTFAQILPEPRRQSYGGAIVDSLISSSGIAGGVGAIWTTQDHDGMAREWLDIRFGLALPLADILYLGLMGKYLSLRQNGYGPLGGSFASGGTPGANIIQTVTLDAGLTVRPIPELKISLTGNNLTGMDTALFPLMGGIGVGFDNEDFGISGDLTMESRTYDQLNLRARGGGEVLLFNQVMLRAGYRYDQRQESHSICGGVGYVNQLFSIDASMRRSVAGPTVTAVVFGITAHIESMGLGSQSSPEGY
jgi:hypothetical protein